MVNDPAGYLVDRFDIGGGAAVDLLRAVGWRGVDRAHRRVVKRAERAAKRIYRTRLDADAAAAEKRALENAHLREQWAKHGLVPNATALALYGMEP